MSDQRARKRHFSISIFNIKVSPKKESEDFTELYANLFRRIHNEEIAINTRGDKFMELRNMFAYEDGRVLYGKLIYYTVLDGNQWYNKETKKIENINLERDIYPNAKEVDYFFIPEAHRFCFVNKTTGIAMSQIEKFLIEALAEVVDEEKEVFVFKELTEDIIENIVNAPKLYWLEVGLTYSNHDLTEHFEKFFDDDMRDGQVERLNLKAQSFKSESIDLERTKILKAALQLSQSNGYAEAGIKNVDGRRERIVTSEHPRKETIRTTEGNEPKGVLDWVLNVFRNG